MSYQNEHAVIGALLINPSAINEIDLTVDDFSIETYRIIYQAIIDMLASNQVADVLTVSSRLQKSAAIDDGWLFVVGNIAKDCASAANICGYAKLIKSEALNRRAKSIFSSCLENIDSAIEGSEIIDAAVGQLMELSVTRKNHECSISQALKKSIEMIEEAAESDGPVGITSGIKKLDDVLSGFHKSDLYVIGARPAMGKTSVLLNFANSHSEQCGIVSTEQPAEQIGLRMISINGKINAQRMRGGKLDDFDYSKISSSVANLHTANNIWINDKSSISILELIRQARKWKHQHDIKIIYIDYIQKIKWTNQNLAKWEQVGNVVGALKELARDLDIPVVALAQVNRDVEKRNDRRPLMGDLANSSEIEKESDVIMTLYRDEVYNEDTDKKGEMEINVCKNRHGSTGYVTVQWLEQFMKIQDFDYRSYSDQEQS